LAPQPGDLHDSPFEHEPMHGPDRRVAVDEESGGDLIVADGWLRPDQRDTMLLGVGESAVRRG
jgi:hypothetical protein